MRVCATAMWLSSCRAWRLSVCPARTSTCSWFAPQPSRIDKPCSATMGSLGPPDRLDID